MKSLADRSPGPNLEYIAVPDPTSIAEAITAFANSDGGTVVLGLTPDGMLASSLLDEEASDALQAALRLCRPPVQTEWQMQEVNGGTVVLLQVARSDEVHRLGDGRVLIRRGAENREITSGEPCALPAHGVPASLS